MKRHVGKAEEWKNVMNARELLLQSLNEESYNECLKRFANLCACFIVFVGYVHNTWLTPFKEKFVQAWANRVIHLGNTTTNRYTNSMNCLISLTLLVIFNI